MKKPNSTPAGLKKYGITDTKITKILNSRMKISFSLKNRLS